MKKITRRNFLQATAAMAATTALAACSSESTTTSTATSSSSTASSSSAASSDAVTEIEFWYSWTDKIEENNISLAEQFNETIGAEKNIKVTAVYQGDYTETHSKLQAAVIAGNAPALSVMEIASTRLFAENGIIMPMEDLIARDGVDMDDFYEGLLENCLVDGTYYGIPYLRSTPILYVNTSLLAAAGLPEEAPATWDDLQLYCETIHEELGIYGLAMYSYDWVLESFFFQQGSSILSDDEMTVNLNTDEGKTIFNFFQALNNNEDIHIYAGADSSKIATDVMNQTTAMWFSSTGDLTKYLAVGEENGFDVITAYIPKAVQYGVPTGGCNLVMTSKLTDAEQEAAWEFIKFATDTDQTVFSSALTGYVTTRKSAVDTAEVAALFESTPQAKIALDQLQDCGHGRPMNPNYSEAANEIVNALDAMWTANADVDTTVATYEATVNAILAQ